MSRKKVRSSRGKRSSSNAKKSPPRSPLPDDVDIFTPLSSLISDHEKLASTAVAFVGWHDVMSMLPPCLQGRSREDVILLVSDELDGMSKRRVLQILQGEDGLASSSSSTSESEDDKSEMYAESAQSSAESEVHSDRSSALCEKADVSTPPFSRSEASESGSERESFSDVELIEGLDADSSNLPDVN
ncbi:unnamed protein product [Cylicocyclus nassatus]|uniref:Uncharacterized protein n=1 Tax=Cylicocyclus nassatus TaxID=53992 RepID=A0AA36HA15_CYLNA|nr:unnamed protein product [Cylicocyclus nassatus]